MKALKLMLHKYEDIDDIDNNWRYRRWDLFIKMIYIFNGISNIFNLCNIDDSLKGICKNAAQKLWNVTKVTIDFSKEW